MNQAQAPQAVEMSQKNVELPTFRYSMDLNSLLTSHAFNWFLYLLLFLIR